MSRATGEIPERLLWAWLVLALLMAALACYRIAIQSIVLGSFEGRWVYRYLQPFGVRILLTGLSVAAAACVLLLSHRTTGRYTWRTVFVWVLLAVALQAVLRSLTLVYVRENLRQRRRQLLFQRHRSATSPTPRSRTSIACGRIGRSMRRATCRGNSW